MDHWGCFKPVEKARWAILCYKCLGSGIIDGQLCTECEGRKSIPQDRCPHSTNTRTCERLFRAIALFKEHGILPQEGGTLNQSILLVNGLNIVEVVLSVLDKVKKEKAEAMKQLAAKAPKVGR